MEPMRICTVHLSPGETLTGSPAYVLDGASLGFTRPVLARFLVVLGIHAVIERHLAMTIISIPIAFMGLHGLSGGGIALHFGKKDSHQIHPETHKGSSPQKKSMAFAPISPHTLA